MCTEQIKALLGESSLPCRSLLVSQARPTRLARLCHHTYCHSIAYMPYSDIQLILADTNAGVSTYNCAIRSTTILAYTYLRFALWKFTRKFLPFFGRETLQLRATSQCKLCPAPPPQLAPRISARRRRCPGALQRCYASYYRSRPFQRVRD